MIRKILGMKEKAPETEVVEHTARVRDRGVELRFVSGETRSYKFTERSRRPIDFDTGYFESVTDLKPDTVRLYSDLSGLTFEEEYKSSVNTENVEEVVRDEILEEREFRAKVRKKGRKYIEVVEEPHEVEDE